MNENSVNARLKKLRRWFDHGGVIFMGYEMFRNLAISKRVKRKKVREDFQRFLLDPGADLVVCDEGHVMRNSKSTLSIIINQVKTRLRVVLTGTPLQNNLLECELLLFHLLPSLPSPPSPSCFPLLSPHLSFLPSPLLSFISFPHLSFLLLPSLTSFSSFLLLPSLTSPSFSFLLLPSLTSPSFSFLPLSFLASLSSLLLSLPFTYLLFLSPTPLQTTPW